MITELRPYPAMKDSGVIWMESIPEHWDVRRHKAVAKLESGHPPSRKVPEYWTNCTTPWFTLGDVHQIRDDQAKYVHVTRERISELGLANSSARRLPRGTVILSRTASVGFSGILGAAMATSQDFVGWIPGPRINGEYLLLVLRAMRPSLKQLMHGSTHNTIYMPMVHSLQMPLPPLPEQAAIVRFLDYADRRIRRYIRAKQKLIRLLEEQKQAIIHRAVTRGLDPDVCLKPSGVEWLGDVPEGWEVMALKRILKRLVDCEHRTAPAIESGPYRVVRTTAVRSGRIRWEGTYSTTPQAFAEWTQRAVPEPGDVIFTREAPAGEACVVPDGAQVCLGQRTVLMKVHRASYAPEFLVWMIYAGPPRDRIRLATQGSTVGHFNMDDIGWMHVLKPPIKEQFVILDLVRRETARLDGVRQRAEREINLLREYRTRLIADVVTGKLDVREAAARLPEEAEEPELVDATKAETDTGGIETDATDEVPEEAEA